VEIVRAALQNDSGGCGGGGSQALVKRRRTHLEFLQSVSRRNERRAEWQRRLRDLAPVHYGTARGGLGAQRSVDSLVTMMLDVTGAGFNRKLIASLLPT
jgi:hypothetical protein